MIKRSLAEILQRNKGKRKALILLGARQTGKTTLLKELFGNRSNVLWLNGDEPDTLAMFSDATSTRLRSMLAGYDTLVVDEAQRIKNVGLKFKLITDQIPEIQLIASGSSAFDLANLVNEPLTGRKLEYHLYPLSFKEMVLHHGQMEEIRLLSHRLIFGYYPDVVTAEGNEKEILHQLSDSYLFKDILMWERIKKPDKLIKLLQALAFQVGSEVSYNELGRMLGLNNETIEKYIQLLEKTFVIFRLGAFSRNLRKELRKGKKFYFYDNGIRNALIANFALPELRQDIGALWENFLMSERMKYLHYQRIWSNSYFWRTQDQQEIDYIEERDGVLHAYEFKWSPAKKARLSRTFSNAYPNHEYSVITRENYMEFLGVG